MATQAFVHNAVGTSGLAESGALLRGFVQGTTTPQTFYTDSALTVPASHPYVADAAGHIRVYYDDTLDWTFQVKSANNASTLLEVDVEGGVVSITYADLANFNGLQDAISEFLEALAGADIDASWVAPLAATYITPQPLDATLTALAALTIVDDGYIQGTGADTFRVRYLQRVTYAALTAIAAADRFDGMRVYVSARATAGDGADGWWRFDSASATAANGGTVLAPDAGTGRWFRIDTTVLKPRQFGAAGNGSTDDSTALQALIGALIDGSQVDGEGKTYRVVTDLLAYKDSGAPDNVTWRNSNFLADGSTSASVIKVFGSGTGLTSVSTVSAGATTVTATGAVAGDARKYLFLASTDKTAPVKADTYVSGELVQIRSVSGTTITLETPTKLAYTTAVTATLVNPIRNWRFENCYVVGDAAKTQRGIQFFRAENCFTDTRGLNVGDATVVFEQTANCRFRHVGGNPGITSDNGFDYGVVEAASVGLSGFVNGYEYRHAFASGGTSGISLLDMIEVHAESMKDAALDSHPNVLALTTKIITRRPRTGGAFSSQPVGLVWQGGGYLDADVTVDGYATSAVLIQPHQASSKDHIKIRGRAINPTSAATRGIEGDLFKAGGSIELIDVEFEAENLTAAGSRGVSFDTNNCASGVSIDTIRIKGLFQGVTYGAVTIARSGHSINSIRYEGKVQQPTAAGLGWAMLGTSNNIAVGQFIGCLTIGAATAVGIRNDNVVHATAVGCRAVGVGGAGINTYAEVTPTLSVGGSYT